MFFPKDITLSWGLEMEDLMWFINAKSIFKALFFQDLEAKSISVVGLISDF